MAQPIGKRLREARLALDLSLEDVQHRTRIRRPMLVAMESDDFSQFGNLTYAAHFLGLYSRHLKVDLGEPLTRFDKGGLSPVAQYRYLQPSRDTTGPAQPRKGPGRSRTPSTIALVSLVTVVSGTIGAAVWYGRWTTPPGGTAAVDQGPLPTQSENLPVPAAPPPPASRSLSDPALAAAEPPSKQLGNPALPVLRAVPVDDTESPGNNTTPADSNRQPGRRQPGPPSSQ